jgi:ribosome-associated heat shock protein Hsp15
VVENAKVIEESKIRLDKWLWFARVVKTRSIAQGLASSGHVRINGQRAESASKAIRIGDVLTIALPSRARVLKVLDTAERRGSASDAKMLYQELG